MITRSSCHGSTIVARDSLVRIGSSIEERHRAKMNDTLRAHERDWRLYPGDGGDPAELSGVALAREHALDMTARQAVMSGRDRSSSWDNEEFERMVERERHRLKHFPVLFVSAPHLDADVNGTFPGMPTPLLFATCLLDRRLRIDDFPAMRVPDVVGVLNPMVYSPAFERELTQLVSSHRPRLVGISNLSEGHHFAIEIARLVKRLSPGTIVIMGGQHETGTNPLVYRRAAERARHRRRLGTRGGPMPRAEVYDLSGDALRGLEGLQTLATPSDREVIDFVAAGDGPHLLLELLVLLGCDPEARPEEFKRTVMANRDRFTRLPGSGFLFWYDDRASVLRSVELSGQPLDRNRLPYIDVGRLRYVNRFPIFGEKKTAQVLACAGCKYTCAFCHESAEQLLYEVPKLLPREPWHVIKELWLRREQGFQAVFFDDSTFTQHRRWIAEFLRLLDEACRQGLALEWGCQTTILDLDAEMLSSMAATGCTYVYFGVESARPASETVQKVAQLRVLTGGADWHSRFLQVARWCHEAGIRAGTSLQFGLGEAPEDRLETLRMVAEAYRQGHIAPGCVALNVNAPYPGTEQWVRMAAGGAALPDYRERLVRNAAFETAHQFTSLDPAEFEAIHAMAVRELNDAILSVNLSQS